MKSFEFVKIAKGRKRKENFYSYGGHFLEYTMNIPSLLTMSSDYYEAV